MAATSIDQSQQQQAVAPESAPTRLEEKGNETKSTKHSNSSENILVRFYKRYVSDNLLQLESNYDCDNFSKL